MSADWSTYCYIPLISPRFSVRCISNRIIICVNFKESEGKWLCCYKNQRLLYQHVRRLFKVHLVCSENFGTKDCLTEDVSFILTFCWLWDVHFVLNLALNCNKMMNERTFIYSVPCNQERLINLDAIKRCFWLIKVTEGNLPE